MSDAVLIAICAAIPPTMTGIAAIVLALKNKKELAKTKKLLDGRLSQLIKAQALLARRRGLEQGRQEAEDKPAPQRRRKPREGG